jgi:hypothetical protein
LPVGTWTFTGASSPPPFKGRSFPKVRDEECGIKAFGVSPRDLSSNIWFGLSSERVGRGNGAAFAYFSSGETAAPFISSTLKG